MENKTPKFPAPPRCGHGRFDFPPFRSPVYYRSVTDSKNVLLYRTGHLGDTVCAIPAFRRVRERFADAELTLLCDRPRGAQVPAADVASGLGVFDRIATYRSGRGLLTLWELRRRVRSAAPDLLLMLPQLQEPPAGVERKRRFFARCGARDARGLNLPFQPRAWQPTEAQRLLRILSAVGIDGPSPGYRIPPRPAARASLAEKLRPGGLDLAAPFVVFCGGGKSATQRWDPWRHGQVLHRLAGRFHLPIVGVGGPADLAGYQAELRPVVPGLKLPPPLTLDELFELLRRALAYWGNDTGPMHVAAAVGCPVAVVMSGRAPPGAWHPDVERKLVFRQRTECEACFLSECVRERHRCLTGISVETVWAGLGPFLEQLLVERQTAAAAAG